MCCERGLTEEIARDRLVARTNCRGPVGPLANEIQLRKLSAISRKLLTAAIALAARAERDEHAIARYDLRNASANPLHNSGSLVAQDRRKREPGFHIAKDEIRMAYSCRFNPYENFVVAGAFQFECLQ